jgi:hypothetical protein
MAITTETPATESFYYDPLLNRLEDILGNPRPVPSRDNKEPLLKPGDTIGRLNEAQLRWGLAVEPDTGLSERIENKIGSALTNLGRVTIKYAPPQGDLPDDTRSLAA